MRPTEERPMVVMSLIEGENAVGILARFRKEARRQGWEKEEIQEVLDDAKSKDYEHLLKTIEKYVHTRH